MIPPDKLRALLSDEPPLAYFQDDRVMVVWDAAREMLAVLHPLEKEEGCRAKLAPGQHWAFCGETDMGSLPALCTECGGDLERA